MAEPSPDARQPGAHRTEPERTFWLALTVVALVHAALIVGVSRSPARQMGEKGRALEAVNVTLIDAGELAGKTGEAHRGDKKPAESVAAPPAPRSDTDAKTASTRALDEKSPSELQDKTGEAHRGDKKPAEPVAAPPAPRPEADARTSGARVLDERSLSELPVDKEMLGSFTPPDPAETQGKAAVQPKDKSSARPKLDLSLPLHQAPESFSAGGWSGSATRPPDITRSGENDEFGRRVIRALRQTMPYLSDIAGRVTVRVLLSQSGNLLQVQLIRSSGDPALDQNVVFAVKQTSFPIPPAKATRSDLTFLVTYIYR